MSQIGIAPLALLLTLVVPLPVEEGRSLLGLPNICPFQHLTGLPCPGCGLTRSLVCLGHGHFADAVRFHPLGPVVFLCLLAASLSRLPLPPRLRAAVTSCTTAKTQAGGGTVLIALLLGIWVARLAGWLPSPP